MSHSLVKVFVHFVWTTKNRERTLAGDARTLVKNHITQYARQNSIAIDAMDVQPEHVHALIRLAHDQKIEEVVRLIKGESSHWVNHNDVVTGKFSWQTGYAAFSVAASGLAVVRSYIANQDEHHRRKPFIEEIRIMFHEAGYSDVEIEEMLRM